MPHFVKVMHFFANLLYIDFIYIFSSVLESCHHSKKKKMAITFDLEKLCFFSDSLFLCFFKLGCTSPLINPTCPRLYGTQFPV